MSLNVIILCTSLDATWTATDVKLTTSKRWFLVKHLEPNVDYEVKVAAFAHDDADPVHSQIRMFKTVGFGESCLIFLDIFVYNFCFSFSFFQRNVVTFIIVCNSGFLFSSVVFISQRKK